ncbi:MULTISPECIES: tetratricopeptide repeat protein [unclassified Sphingopyxis]|jgi:cellulose synthase operon protein C|uniref:tetratricopeptide repeat protein n=1 Tax=unclassified Sphingopyxis TaxID=2614943 RepID=UPI002855FF22|nr:MULTISPECIES: tetratricopeptide repeat protein [unclassified Sphingopyxis]MDR6835012.1 tetratricopeptide (TPR) repeat protein [Sphingopyxis sp. BE122]MDR7227283.1 tetratricopeptide (TPR) repeat protein [Sphingopyxis sp. BE259]
MTPGRAWTSTLLIAVVLAGCGYARPDAPRQGFAERRAELQTAIADNPQAIAARVELARVAIQLGDGVGAEAAVKGALSAGGNAAALRPLLARAYAMQGEGQRALETIDAGPIIPEMIGEAAWVAGDVHLTRGDLDAARDAYDRAVRDLPRNSALWVDVARFRGANADTAGARDAIDYAIELDKANSGALAYKANLIRTEDGLTASLKWYDQALAADPDNADALIDQAATLGDLGRYRDMLTALRHAATIVPRDPRLFYLQAVLAARAENYRLARSLLQRTRGELDNLPGFMLLSAIVELELGGEAVAATWADRLLIEQPYNLTARRILAVANWADGDADGAIEALLPIVDRPDADSWSLLLAARAASELGRRGEAGDFLARAATLSRGEALPFAPSDDYGVLTQAADAAPLNPAVAIPAVAADILRGNSASAIARAAQLRDANRGVADAHILLGDAALAGGRFDLAVQAYRTARDLDASERTTLRLANALFRAGDAAGSGAAILALRDSQPSSIAADRLAGHLAMDIEHWDEAIAHFERVRRRIGDRDAVVLRELARAWAAKGDTDRALPLIDRAYRLQPLNGGVMAFYADLLERRGDGQAAADLREKAAQAGR